MLRTSVLQAGDAGAAPAWTPFRWLSLPADATLSGLRTALQSAYGTDVSKHLLTRPSTSYNATESYRVLSEDAALTLLGLENGSSVYVEQPVADGQTPASSAEITRVKSLVRLRYNIPPAPEQLQSLFFDKRASTLSLRGALSKVRCLQLRSL
jgi:hypothetical protein